MLVNLAKLNVQNETTVLAVGCTRPETMSVFARLQDMLKGVLNIIKIAKFEIDRILKEYVGAMQATAQSL